MSCNCGNSSGFNGSCNKCSKVPDIDTETPLDTIKNGDDNFCFNEVTEEICTNLKDDKGIHPFNGENNNNCTDLHALNQYLMGDLWNGLKTLDFCDINSLKCWLYEFVSNNWNLNKAEICSICGLWEYIHDLIKIIVKDGYVSVNKVYSYTVAKDKFVRTGNIDPVIFWSGSIEKGESFISIPVAEMDIVDGVFAQPQVAGGRVHPVTVAIQSAIKTGDNYEVNFDTYEIRGGTDSGYPFAVTINFFVMGRKKIKNSFID